MSGNSHLLLEGNLELALTRRLYVGISSLWERDVLRPAHLLHVSE